MHLPKRRFFKFSCAVVFGLLLNLGIWWYMYLGTSPVEGWDGVSRNASHYVSEVLTPHLMPTGFCEEEKILVVMVCSKPDGFELRRAIRDTWGQKHTNASVFFLIGEVPHNSIVLKHQLEAESIQFGDIIQERFMDGYNNLTLKSINMLKLFNKYCAATHKYLLKTDDDIFLDLEATVKYLGGREYHYDTLLGKTNSKIAPYRRWNSKWYMPYEWFPGDTYPDFLCGSAYLMSADVVQKLYKCAMEVPLLHTEDVYLTGICAKRVGVVPTHSDKFTCDKGDSHVCDERKVWTLHYYTADAIRKSYKIVKKNKCGERRWYNVLKENIFKFL